MEHIKKNFGFMRLPMKDGGIDLAQTSEMVDAFLDAGFNYFDAAHGYLGGKSETALKTCLHQPLLHGRLSQAHFHSGSVCHHEHQAALPRLERGLLLQCGPHGSGPQGLRLPQVRQV